MARCLLVVEYRGEAASKSVIGKKFRASKRDFTTLSPAVDHSWSRKRDRPRNGTTFPSARLQSRPRIEEFIHSLQKIPLFIHLFIFRISRNQIIIFSRRKDTYFFLLLFFFHLLAEENIRGEWAVHRSHDGGPHNGGTSRRSFPWTSICIGLPRIDSGGMPTTWSSSSFTSRRRFRPGCSLNELVAFVVSTKRFNQEISFEKKRRKRKVRRIEFNPEEEIVAVEIRSTIIRIFHCWKERQFPRN